jgi:hypothetical protein
VQWRQEAKLEKNMKETRNELKRMMGSALWVAPVLLVLLSCLSVGAQSGPPNGVAATAAALRRPHGVAYDSAGNSYVADTDANVIRKVTPAGIVTTVAGDGEQGYAGDGGLATAAILDSPTGVALDSNGNIYIADTHNNAIREVVASTGNIQTIAGTGVAGYSGDNSTATSATLNSPTAVAVDSNGNVYIADTNNHRIREITGATINTVAGDGEQFFSGDGGLATVAGLDSPNGVAVDSAFNIYIGDTHNQRVRMVTSATGNISTLAGTGTKGFNGDGPAASAVLARPRGVTVDGSGNVYLADTDNNLIRTIASGNVTTIAGSGAEGYAGDGGAATSASLDMPGAVAISGNSVLFSDTENNALRLVSGGIIYSTAGQFSPPVLTSPTPGSVLGTTNITFSWASGPSVYAYDLYLGTAGPGTDNLYNSAGISTTSVTIPTLPSLGATIYARLFYQYQYLGPWQYVDYTYTESPSAAAVLTSPTPGSVLGATNVVFSWTPGAGVTAYDLYIGTTGAGSANLYNSTAITTTSFTAPTLPSIGAAVYVRLSYKINGTWQNSDYTYTESPSVAPVLTSPTPGSVIGTSNVVFSWTPGAGVTAYDLYIGNTGVGSSNLYNSAGVTTTSVPVPALPSLGATLYVRLSYRINGTWQNSDYTYTESPSAAPVLTSPAPGSVVGASNVTFSWTPGAGVTAYDLYLGTTGVGSANLYNSTGVTTTSVTVPTLPSLGATVYARLSYRINGAWQNSDYTYTEPPSAAPVLSSPTPGSVLGASNVVFSWTSGAGVTAYDLYLGTTGVGSANLYNSGAVTTTSFTAPTLPSIGATIYARLSYRINGAWQSTDYTYTESPSAAPVLTSPTPGSVLGTTNVVFSWTPGAGVTVYDLYLGTTGAGSVNLYNSASVTTTSVTVPTVPSKGATVYARLYYQIKGVWQFSDYTYTEP